MEKDREAVIRGCKLGDLGLIRAALSGSPGLINEKEEGTGWTPLFCAGVFGHSEVILYLLEQGGDPNICSSHGDSLLHYAAASGQYRTAGFILEAGANPNAQNLGKIYVRWRHASASREFEGGL